jgi:hypothetical protein
LRQDFHRLKFLASGKFKKFGIAATDAAQSATLHPEGETKTRALAAGGRHHAAYADGWKDKALVPLFKTVMTFCHFSPRLISFKTSVLSY